MIRDEPGMNPGYLTSHAIGLTTRTCGKKLYVARLFVRNLLKPRQSPSIVKYCYQLCSIKKLIKMLFTVHYLLLLSSLAFQTLLIRLS